MNLNIQLPIAIIGLGKSGNSALKFLTLNKISNNQIFSFDDKDPKADFNQIDKLLSHINPQTYIVSPGYPLSHQWLQNELLKGKSILSEIDLATSILTDEKIIGITGSLGKSTTVALLGVGLSAFSKNYFVGGNFGIPFCEYASEIITGSRNKADWIILELSSYQLENSNSLNLDYAGITYLSANHMERYKDLKHYYETKLSILNKTKQSIYLNKNGGDLFSYWSNNNISTTNDLNWTHPDLPDLQIYNLINKNLIGSHNLDNLAMAAKIAKDLSWPSEAVDKMKLFSGLPHRLENIGRINNILFINDSKATAIDSVISAVNSINAERSENSRVHLLLGGKDKNLPWVNLNILKDHEHITFYFFGECKEIACSQSQLPGNFYPNLKFATIAACNSAHAGDIVLLSPGGTSLDEFKNFEERGNYFKEIVKSLYKA